MKEFRSGCRARARLTGTSNSASYTGATPLNAYRWSRIVPWCVMRRRTMCQKVSFRTHIHSLECMLGMYDNDDVEKVFEDFWNQRTWHGFLHVVLERDVMCVHCFEGTHVSQILSRYTWCWWMRRFYFVIWWHTANGDIVNKVLLALHSNIYDKV